MKLKLFIFFLLLISWTLTACQNSEIKTQTEETIEFTDDLQRKVKLPKNITRVVSLAPNLTENVFAVGAGEKLIGVTEFCNFPAEAVKIQKVGDTITPNVETILALKPQVVLVSTASQIEGIYKKLEANGTAVFVTNPTNLESLYRNLLQFGEIFGKKEKAVELVESLKKRVAEVESKSVKTEKPKVFVQISKEPLFTVGKTAFITDLINRAGGISVTQNVEEPYPNFSKEPALASAPEVIILSESEDNKEPNEVLRNSPAVKNKKVFKINADILSRPGPRMVDALEEIAKILR